MATPYATEAQLLEFLPSGTTVEDGPRLLARASELVDDVVRLPFALDTQTGLPSDATIAEALRDATCAQVEQWLEVDEANDVDGLASTQVTLPGYNGRRAPALAPRALRILRQNGLTDSRALDDTAARFFATQAGT